MLAPSTVRALKKIATDVIGREFVDSVNVMAVDETEDGPAIQIGIVSAAGAPKVLGDTYLEILLRARDYLASHDDPRRAFVTLKRVRAKSERAVASSAK